MALSYKWFKFPFASSGDVTAIPDAVQGDGSVSYPQGYGPDYALDPATQPAALNIERDKANQLYLDITKALQWLQAGNTPQWISAADNGGVSYAYAANAIVLYTDGWRYQSLIAANTDTPGATSSWAKLRTRLNATTTFYVSTTGSDSTGNGTLATPWATGTFAYSFIQNNYDLNGKTVVIQFVDGTTYANVSASGRLTGQTAASQCIFQGNVGSPSNVIVAGLASTNGAMVTPQAMKIANPAGDGLDASFQGNITLGTGLVFGACSAAHMNAFRGGTILRNNNYTINGNGSYHMLANAWSSIASSGIIVTLTGTPAFATAFAGCAQVSSITDFGLTYSGAATGARYAVSENGAISTNGGGANYFPGNAAGFTATGGQYN